MSKQGEIFVSSPKVTPSREAIWLGYRSYGKRILDLMIAIPALIVSAPIILIAALFIMLDGGNPFFRQQRVGFGGKIFNMYKLRSMISDAETVLDSYLETNPAAREEWETKQKLTDDPRITLVGRIIRKTSIDELPQFWNVMTGDMSVVGPRPMMPSQQSLYPGTAYYKLRPGITGPWQVSGRSSSSFAARSKFDYRYLTNFSLYYDLMLLFRTFSAVARGTGT